MAGIKIRVLSIGALITILSLTGCKNDLQTYIDSFIVGPKSIARVTATGAADFGFSVDADGDYMITGAPAEKNNTTHEEAAYIYHRKADGTWDSGFKLPQPADWTAGDRYGYAVAIYGDYAAVGAPNKDVSGTNEAGTVYLYKRTDVNTWVFNAKYKADDAGDSIREFGWFGFSLAMDGSWLLIGSPQVDKNDNQTDDYGAVYAFRNISGWSYADKLTANTDVQEGAQFGYSVDINEGYAVVGAPFEKKTVDATEYSKVGAVYLFSSLVDNWDNKERITADDWNSGGSSPAANQNLFGLSVSLTADFLAVSAPNKTVGGVDFAGSVYVYKAENGTWNTVPLHLSVDTPVTGDFYGAAVVLRKETLIISSSFRDTDNVTDTGNAYIYKNATGTNNWYFQKNLLPQEPQENTYFGKAVTIADGFIAVGACHTYEYFDKGAVYIFE